MNTAVAVLGRDALALVGDQVDRGLVAQRGPAALDAHGAARRAARRSRAGWPTTWSSLSGSAHSSGEVVGDVDDEPLALAAGRDASLDWRLEHGGAGRRAGGAP